MKSARRRIPISRGGERVITVTKPEPPDPEVPPVFTEMQRSMEDELERRRKDWEREVERMQQDFFNIKSPSSASNTSQLSDEEFDNVTRNLAVKLGSSPARSPGGGATIDLNNTKTNLIERPDGSRVYRLRFDVAGFDPSEVKVKGEGQKLFISALREVDHGNGHKSTKQFSRQVDIPECVDLDDLVATVSNDGFLNIEGSVDERRRPSPLCSPEPLVSPPQYYSVVRAHRSPPRSPRTVAHSPVLVTSPRYVTHAGGGGGAPLVVAVNDVRKLKMSVDIGPEFDAGDVVVKLVGAKIQVHARHEETVGGRSSKREFSREFDLPERLEETSLRATLAPDGRLVVGASVLSNLTHSEAVDSVMRDMPIEGTPVRVVVI